MQDDAYGYAGKVTLDFVKNKNKLQFLLASGLLAEITLPSSLNEKDVVLWMTRSFNSSLLKVSKSNYSAKLIISTAIGFETHNFIFTTEDGTIKKFMYSPNFYDFDSEQYHRIMLKEKLNGSYVL